MECDGVTDWVIPPQRGMTQSDFSFLYTGGCAPAARRWPAVVKV